MHISVITLFPQMFASLDFGICGRARKKGLFEIQFINPRDFTDNIHQTVDDKPYGGGAGMVLKAEPLVKAIQSAKNQPLQAAPHTVYLTPQGKRLTQAALENFAKLPHLIIICGRYEGIDQRVVNLCVDEEWSIGDYVLSGGEFPGMVLIDGIIRLLPNALGAQESLQHESFNEGLLDFPQYTRPENYEGMRVPEVLLSGHHNQIARWRLKQALGKTWLNRPDLLKQRALTDLEQELLNEFIAEPSP